jgi:hypothetical protein
MNLKQFRNVLILGAGSLAITLAGDGGPKRPFGIEARTPWTTSRVRGTPEPPPGFRTERVWPKIQFKNPTVITRGLLI